MRRLEGKEETWSWTSGSSNANILSYPGAAQRVCISEASISLAEDSIHVLRNK